MATLNDNKGVLIIDSVDVSGYWTELKPKAKNNVKEISAGANITHVQRGKGLNDYSFDATIVYDDVSATLQSYLVKLKPGNKYIVEYYPEGKVTGKPKHVQSMIVDSVNGPSQKVEKDLVTFEISFSGADAPTYDMYDGAVY
jgi:hypothetical protein